MLALLSSLPVVGSIINAIGNFGVKLYDAKLQAQGTHEAKVVELAKREIDLDETEARLNSQAKAQIRGIWYAPENLFGYIMVSYYGSAILLDSVIAPKLGFSWFTPRLTGETLEASKQIMLFWLGARGLQMTAGIIAGAFGRK